MRVTRTLRSTRLVLARFLRRAELAPFSPNSALLSLLQARLAFITAILDPNYCQYRSKDVPLDPISNHTRHVHFRVPRTAMLSKLSRTVRVASRHRNKLVLCQLLSCCLFVITLIVWVLVLSITNHSTLTFPPPLQKATNVLLVLAHPDDESLFFGPTILQLVRRKPPSATHLLFLSSGEFETTSIITRPQISFVSNPGPFDPIPYAPKTINEDPWLTRRNVRPILLQAITMASDLNES